MGRGMKRRRRTAGTAGGARKTNYPALQKKVAGLRALLVKASERLAEIETELRNAKAPSVVEKLTKERRSLEARRPVLLRKMIRIMRDRGVMSDYAYGASYEEMAKRWGKTQGALSVRIAGMKKENPHLAARLEGLRKDAKKATKTIRKAVKDAQKKLQGKPLLVDEDGNTLRIRARRKQSEESLDRIYEKALRRAGKLPNERLINEIKSYREKHAEASKLGQRMRDEWTKNPKDGKPTWISAEAKKVYINALRNENILVMELRGLEREAIRRGLMRQEYY